MLLAHHGVESSSSYTMPAGPRGIGPLLLAVAQDMLVGYVEENLSSFDVVASRFDGVGAYVPVTTRLMPASPPPEATPVRTRYVDAQTLGAVAIRELLYIEIHGILLDALASEHGARLAATQAAEGWLGRRIDELRHHLTSARRESSTQEVIEIASGARARGRKPGWV
jgi:F-type H+-transporting ATPase subunit gamma